VLRFREVANHHRVNRDDMPVVDHAPQHGLRPLARMNAPLMFARRITIECKFARPALRWRASRMSEERAMKELRGRTAFITGGGSGVGLGQAKAFAAAGMNVVIADIREDHLDSAEEAERTFGPVRLLCNERRVAVMRQRMQERREQASH
jgi:hypothetical protein